MYLESKYKLVSLRSASKIFKWGPYVIKAVDRVNLDIIKGNFISIMGPSGSGKTTLLNLIGCLTIPTYGEVLIKGINVKELNDSDMSRLRNKTIGFIFQAYNLFPTLTALENVILPMLFSKRGDGKSAGDPERNIRKAKDLLTRFGLKDRMSHYPKILSLGEQQRVAIARALINDPELIIADEPTGTLDSFAAKEVTDLLKRLNEEGRTVVMVTHDPEVGIVAKIRYRLRDGKLTNM